MNETQGQEACFADTGTGCRALENACCPGCKFRKTTSQVEQEKANSIERLKSLGIWEYIKAKYGIREGKEATP